MGQRNLRRLLITGAMAVAQNTIRRGEITDPWLAGMLARKPKVLVVVAVANRTARMVRALTTRMRSTGFALPVDNQAGTAEKRKRIKRSGNVGRTQARVRAHGQEGDST